MVYSTVEKKNDRHLFQNLILLLIGGFFYTFVGWRWNMPLAAWISLICLVQFSRNQKRIRNLWILVPILIVPTFLKMYKGWDLDLYMVVLFTLIFPIVFIVFPLLIDKLLIKHFSPIISSLIFPSSILSVEYLVGLTPLGTGFSLGATQFEHAVLIQLSSITGLWGISFIIAWSASVVNLFWVRKESLRKPSNLTKIYASIIIVIMLFGSLRLALFEPQAETVRIASITVPHTKDYWGEIVDLKTPFEGSVGFKTEFQVIEDELFNLSSKAVNTGSQIIFWSEGNAPFYEDQEAQFLNRCINFTQTHHVYLLAGVLKLYYNSYISDNMVFMITPEGEIAFEYIKTISWYPTNSDGIIDYVDTPFGRISATICFDNDFPNFIRQAGKNNVDILLVPAFDTPIIKNFHTKSSLIRGIENGMSVIRQSNHGTSMGIDYQGNVLAFQDYFDTEEKLMFTDLPIKGVKTVYSYLGDWLIYLNFGCLTVIIILNFSKKKIKSSK